MRRHITRWLFITLLLVGQAVLSAHSADIDAHAGGGDTCTLCLLGSGLDHQAATVQFAFPVPPPAHQSAVSHPYIRLSQATRADYRSRAPPITRS